ncbi:MAG: DUF192 domain-containing protein [Thermoleophilia bacterium]
MSRRGIAGMRSLAEKGPRALFDYHLNFNALTALLITGLVFFSGCAGDGAVTAGDSPTLSAPEQTAITTASGRASVTFFTGGGDIILDAHIARTPDERSRGLMFVRRLEPDTGMIFVWDAPATGGFWMKNTLIPLSIAFIADDLTIIDIQDMEPGSLEPHSPQGAYRYAIEVNQGYFSEHGIAVGDRVGLEGV